VKRIPVTAIILLAIVGALAFKLVTKEIESRAQSERFLGYVATMPESARPFITREFPEIHPDAFRDAYSLWVFWPLDEFRLGAEFDQRRYFQLVHDHIVGTATREGETRAIPAIRSLTTRYGIPEAPAGQPSAPPQAAGRN
jgi:hypothetical protein